MSRLALVLLAAIIMAQSYPAFAEYRMVNADEILKKIITEKPVTLEKVAVEGDLNLSGQSVNSTLAITNSTIEKANFRGTGFLQALDMEGTRFQDSVDFSGGPIPKRRKLQRRGVSGDASFFLAEFLRFFAVLNGCTRGPDFLCASLAPVVKS